MGILRDLKKYLCNPWKNNVTRGCGFLEYFLATQRAKIANRFISYGHKSGRVLDIGCGSYPIFLITSKFVEKFGIDKINYPQKRLLRKFKLINYDIQDGDNLPFDDGYIDVVTMLAVLEHIKYLSLPNIISEVYRIIKPGGLFIVTVPSPHSGFLLDIMAKLGLISKVEINDHKINLSNAELLELLKESKFNNAKYGYFECYLNRWFIAEKYSKPITNFGLKFKDSKILMVSRANAREDGNLYFQNLDGGYLDGIAKGFKGMEILAPIHKKGIHPTYEMYRNYTYKFQSPNVNITDMAGVKSYSKNIFTHLKRLYDEIKILKKKIKSADFVFIFMSTVKAAIAVRLCLNHRKPFVIYLGNDWAQDAKYHYRWSNGILRYCKLPYIKLCAFLERWVMKNSPIKLINSPALYKKYKNSKGYTEEARPLLQINHSDYFHREDTCCRAVIKVLSVGAIMPRKGLEYLIEGFLIVQNTLPGTELHLAGVVSDRFYKGTLERLIDANGVNQKVFWYDYVPHGPKLLDLYRDSDIFVLSSLSEGFPRVIWEAMSQGVPVISTGLENIYEKIGKEDAVCFVKPANSKDIAEAIIKIVKDEEYRKELIERGYRCVKEAQKESAPEQFLRIIGNQFL